MTFVAQAVGDPAQDLYEAFGTSVEGIHSRYVARGGHFPDDELTAGIAHVHVTVELHGDSPTPFVHVYGTDRAAVERTWVSTWRQARPEEWIAP